MTNVNKQSAASDAVPRITALIKAQETLAAEGIVVGAMNTEIKNRIAELLQLNPEILGLIAEFHARTFSIAELSAPKVEAPAPAVPAPVATKTKAEVEAPAKSEIPGLIMAKLSTDEYKIVQTLLKFGPNGQVVSLRDLNMELYGQDTDGENSYSPIRGTLRVRISMANKKLNGYAKITASNGSRGYYLTINNK